MAPTALGESEAALTRQLRDALAQLYDEHALQRHPLAAAMPGDSRQHRGRELRQRLTAAIDGLRPESPSSPNARLHRLVTLRYVEAWDAPEGAEYHGPALFIAGATSTYIKAEHRPIIRRLFPRARFVTLKNAGHWLHADNPTGFIGVVEAFLTGTA